MDESVQPVSVAPRDNALPLVVAVTGHRDLVPAEVPGLRERVRDLLEDLAARYPDRRLSVMSPLAEGADRLVAEVALDLGVGVTVPLPMRKTLYKQDFVERNSGKKFDLLCERADDVFELPLARGNTEEQILFPGPARNRQYAQVGIFLCAHCHILLAIWDGKPSPDLGGTGQVVKFHHDDIMPGYTQATLASQQSLVDDESDLVYHIVCSRNRPNGSPHPDFIPLESFWFSKDRDNPRSDEIPKQHETIFLRSDEFSRDAIRFAGQIEAEKYPLLEDSDRDYLPRGIDEINRIFCIADRKSVV